MQRLSTLLTTLLLIAACGTTTQVSAPSSSVPPASQRGGAVAGAKAAPAERPWLDATLATPERVEALLSEMSLEEKAAQMISAWRKKPEWIYDSLLNVRLDSMRVHYPHGLGQITRPSDGFGPPGLLTQKQTIDLTNAVQRYFVEETRLGIPVFYHEEALHGFAAKGGTSYPQPIALAGTFDPALVRRVFTEVASEVRSYGAHQVLSPVLDICRDPRWGRVEETYGEDPYLAGEIGKAAVGGFQGGRDYDGADAEHVLATLKHLTGHGVPEGGNNIGPAFLSERYLREVFFYPFKEVIAAEKPGALMASYNEIDGVPSHANTWMLQDVLRGEMGFEGFVVSDYFALRELNHTEQQAAHHVARDEFEAAFLGLRAGVNIELPDADIYPSIPEVVRSGKISEARIDELLRPMLAAKFDFGLFEDPYVELDPVQPKIDAARPLSREVAGKSIVLIQNRNNRLPMAKGQTRIAAIGPNMDRSLLGGYSGQPTYEVSALEGLKEAYGEANVTYAQGAYITTTSGWGNDSVAFPTFEQDEALIEEAVALAQNSDVLVVAIGGNEQTSREAWAKNHLGDRTDLELVGRQNELIDRLAATGKPIVALVFGGRPLALQNVLDKCDAVLQCWYVGQETGGAVADVLTGAVNPSAKLAISFPRSVGHIPAHYGRKPSSRRGYLADSTSSLLPFGYGLSYTSFRVSAPSLSASTIRPDGSVTVTASVTNTGSVAGAEVVQLYLRDLYASVTRPLLELKGFEKVMLQPGETKEVTFQLTPKQLAFYNIDMDFVVEPGEFEVYVGTSSRLGDLKMVSFAVEGEG